MADASTSHVASEFHPAPALDLGDAAVRRDLLEALSRVREEAASGALGSGPEEGRLSSFNPARSSEVLGSVRVASASDVEAGLLQARRAFEAWRSVPDGERIALLGRVAQRMRERRHELAATVLLETGKNWSEADGEVAESIDFLEFHALAYRDLVARAETAVLPHPREKNRYRYLPLGAGALLPPWPFPIAQLTAMVSAAVVAGNTVVVKPASLAPMTSAKVVELWREAGAPHGVINVLFGPGGTVGAALVRNSLTRFVTLTGASSTGRAVSANLHSDLGSRDHFPRLAMELGGKNPVVVDETADLELAAKAVVEGAFGFSGQKCSAGSRLIVVAGVHDELVDRVIDRAERLVIGYPEAFDTDLGPLIDDEAVERWRRFVDVARREGRVVSGGEYALGEPRFAQPTVALDVQPGAVIARDEVMAPFLAVTAARDVRDAIAIANDSQFGLTGSFFSRDEDRLQLAQRELSVGSLYLNRKTTASEVGFHPFGGFRLSGTDAKAGGPDYLFSYVQAQTITRAG